MANFSSFFLVLFFSLSSIFFLVQSADAKHSSWTRSHARKSLDLKERSFGNTALRRDTGLIPNLANSIIQAITGPPPSSNTSSTNTTSSTNSTSDGSPPSNSSDSTPPGSGSSSNSTSPGSGPPDNSTSPGSPTNSTGNDSGQNGTTSNPPGQGSSNNSTVTPPPTSSPTTSLPASTTTSCILGIGILGIEIDGICTTITPSPTPPDNGNTDTNTNTTTSPTDTGSGPAQTPPPDNSTPPPDNSTPPPTTTTPPPTTSSDCVLSLDLFGNTVCVPPPDQTPPPSNTTTTPPPDTTTDTGSDGGPTTTSCDPLDIACNLGLLPTTTTTSDAPPPTTTDGGTATDTNTDTNTGSPTTTDTGTGSPTTTDTSGQTTVISFPTGTGNTTAGTGTDTSLITVTQLSSGDDSTATSTFSPPPLSSQFSFLTQSSLLVSSVPTAQASVPTTLTNPDAPTATQALDGISQTTASATQVPLPSGLPARIYPAEGGVTPNDDLTGYTAVSLMFNAQLGWNFVVNTPDCAPQIFAYLPDCIEAALGISADQVKFFALQVWEPSDYDSPSDVDVLRTLAIFYIPSDTVDLLAQEVKAKQSAFYTESPGIAGELAARVDPAFGVTSIGNPISDSGSPGSPSTSSASSSSESNSRLDAIIGVCSAVGGIGLCILAWLGIRNYRRKKEMQHRRLSDPVVEGVPGPDHEFDRDSVGGQRRRSFYYAEDSLRGYAQTSNDDAYEHQMSQAGGMRERRTIIPGTISAPILRDNTLNW